MSVRRILRSLAPLAILPLIGARCPRAPIGDPVSPICHVETKEDAAPAATEILAGYGTGGFAIRTSDPRAQAYFDNGMQLAHAFAHKAATGAFIRAERIDPACALCIWGEAWSRGPTINYGVSAKERAKLLALADKAAILAAHDPASEQALIAALQQRYRDKDGDDAFARAMDDLAKANPDDNEIAVMAADAWLIAAGDGDRHQRLDRAIAILKPALVRSPDDTGLIHFYIHATEMDGVAIDALPYARRLQALAPAASHLVHMPSHTYFRAGWYRQAEQSNLEAVKIDEANARRLKLKDGVFGLFYHGHNVQFGTGSALMAGDAEGALVLASAEVSQVPTLKPDEPYAQIAAGTAYFAFGRFGAPAEVAALTDPGVKLPYARAMWRYARGEAAARAGDVAAVKREGEAVRLSAADAKSLGGMGSRAQTLATMAQLVLEGRASMIERRWGEAAKAYGRAADLQDTKLGDFSDPPSWWYPIRRSLAAALLAGGRPDAAADQATKAMNRWPHDPLSQKVLADSQAALGHAVDARRQMDLARANWAGSLSFMPLALV